jgi:hypothetical protein
MKLASVRKQRQLSALIEAAAAEAKNLIRDQVD